MMVLLDILRGFVCYVLVIGSAIFIGWVVLPVHSDSRMAVAIIGGAFVLIGVVAVVFVVFAIATLYKV